MKHTTTERRDPLPGETIRGGKFVNGRVVGGRLEHGPRAFFQPMSPDYGVLCDPDVPIEHDARVLVTLPDGSQFDGTVVTKRPTRAKTVNVRLLINGGVLRKVRKECITRVMSISGRGSAIGRATV